MEKKEKISVVIPIKNNEKTIEKTLKSTENFNEVLLVDTGSSDNSLEIIKTFKNTKIVKTKFLGFGSIRNFGATLSKNDWILALDSDEVVTKELFSEILKLNFEENSIYSIPFINFYNNKIIKCCGWHPEYHARLYNKKFTKFSNSLVHEKLISKNNKITKLKNSIYHFSYRSIEDFLIKMDRYSSLFAKQNFLKKRSSFSKAIFHGIFAFFKSYIIKRGIFGGKEGFIISIYNANTSFYKYLKLYEINKKEKC